jgi:hypothetical protein
VFVFGTVKKFRSVVFLRCTPTFNPMTFLYESRFFSFCLELLFLKEILGSFASIASHFVMNRSLLKTICATAFKLAVMVSSVVLINLISPASFVEGVSS